MNRRTFLMAVPAVAQAQTPFRLAIAGLVHGHARGFLNRMRGRGDVKLAGIAEPDRELAERYASQFSLDRALLFSSVEEMLDKVKPEAVGAFTSTFDHAEVVDKCAARHVPVMMEKPLAVSNEHSRAIATAARAGRIPVIVNYETTWYKSNRAAWRMIKQQKSIGEIRKMVVHDGHKGPKEIGVGPEFLSWLTDPVKNGAGALFDFGCYGANLCTWLMENQRPLTVSATTQTFKPEIYSKVDDEATIILTYPKAQAIIQASWNWPIDRKDMAIYGQAGWIYAGRNDEAFRFRIAGQPEQTVEIEPLPAPEDDPVNYLAAVARGRMEAGGLSGLQNNLIVTEILSAARESARSGQVVRLGG